MSEVKKRGKSSKTKDPAVVAEPTGDKNLSKKTKSDKKNDDAIASDEPAPPKFGPMPKLSPHRLWSRTALILGLMTVVWYNSTKKQETTFAQVGEDIRYRGMKTKCSQQFDTRIKKFSSCVPNHCGRLVTDEIITPEEMFALSDLVQRGFSPLKGEAGTAVLDLHTGIIKYSGGKTISLSKQKKPVFENGDLLIFQSIKSKLSRMVSSYFGVDFWSLHLAKPVFFSRISGPVEKSAKSDEYWHPTVHQELFGVYDYSTTLFLSDYDRDFAGGRFIFLDGDNTNRTVDPRKGRALGFTSAEESRHFTEKVTRGTRLAFTMGFTCDATKAAKDPTF